MNETEPGTSDPNSNRSDSDDIDLEAVDDGAGSDIDDDQSEDEHRLNIRDVAIFAANAAYELERHIRGGCVDPYIGRGHELPELARKIIMEASAQNHNAVMQYHWDLRLGKRLEDGWKYGPQFLPGAKIDPECLPWVALPEVTRMREIYFRQSVLAIMKAWAGD